MVVSNNRLAHDSQVYEAANLPKRVRERWIPSTILAAIVYVRQLFTVSHDTGRSTGRREWIITGQRQASSPGRTLAERSSMMFRRENQGESFDDDVAALRDRVGSGQREQDEPAQDSTDDQTTYSPPRQSWRPVTQSAESGLDPVQPQQPAWQPAENGNASVIAADTTWDGSVQSNRSLHVHGNVSGQMRVEGDVFIAEGATVNADVMAGGVTVAGTLEGTVECSGRFEVLPSGSVSANVAAPRLVVHEGARVIGNLRMTTAGD